MPSPHTSTQRPARRTQADRSDQAVSALRAAALDMLLERGVAGLSLSEIGDRAGYSRGIVHYHFGSKETLLADLLGSLADSGRKAFVDAEGKGLGAILQIIANIEARVASEPQQSLARIILINEAAASQSETFRRLATNYNRLSRRAFEEKIREEATIADSPLSVSALAMLLLSVIRGIHEQWLAERETFDIGVALGDLRHLIEAGSFFGR